MYCKNGPFSAKSWKCYVAYISYVHYGNVCKCMHTFPIFMLKFPYNYVHLNQKPWRSCPWYLSATCLLPCSSLCLVYLNLLSIISCTRKFMVKSTFASLMLFNTSRMLPTDFCPLRVFRTVCTLSSDRAPSSMLECIYNTCLQNVHFNYDIA